MQCPACQNEVGPQAAFCNHCGATLTPAAAPVPSQPAYPPTPGYSEVAPAYNPPPAYNAPPAGYAPPPGYQQAPPNYAPPPGYQQPPTAYPGPPPSGNSGLSETAAAAVAYITFIPAIIFLVVEPYNKIPLVRFHSYQSIALAVVAFVIQMAVTILAIVVAFIPVFGLLSLLFTFVHLGLFVMFFILWIMAIMKASKGEWYKIPMIGDWAMKQAQS